MSRLNLPYANVSLGMILVVFGLVFISLGLDDPTGFILAGMMLPFLVAIDLRYHVDGFPTWSSAIVGSMLMALLFGVALISAVALADLRDWTEKLISFLGFVGWGLVLFGSAVIGMTAVRNFVRQTRTT